MNLAEKHIVCRQLHETVVGKTIIKAVVNQNPHSFVWFALNPSQMFCTGDANNRVASGYEILMTGKKIGQAAVIGSNLYLFIGRRALSIHFTPQYHEKGINPQKNINFCWYLTMAPVSHLQVRLAELYSSSK